MNPVGPGGIPGLMDSPNDTDSSNAPAFLEWPQSGPTDLSPQEPEPQTVELPPAADLIKLLGVPATLEVVRAARLEREIFFGFRPGRKSLDHPVIRRRFAEALRSPALLEAAAERWKLLRQPLWAEVENLGSDPAPDELQELSQKRGLAALRWALILQSRADVLDVLTETKPADVPDGTTASPEIEAQSTASAAADHCVPPQMSGSAAAPMPAVLQHSREKIELIEDHLRESRKELLAAQSREKELGRENESLRKQLEESRRGREELQRQMGSELAESRSRARQLERLQKALDESNHRASTAEKEARKAARELAEKPAPAPPRPQPKAALETRTLPPAEKVLARLMENHSYAAAAEYARAAWEMDSNLSTAFEWLMEALQQDGQWEEAARLQYQAAIRALQQESHSAAVEALCESIRLAPNAAEASWRMEKLLQTADPASRRDLEVVAKLYGELRRKSADAAAQFEGLARRTRRSLWRRLPPLLAEEHRRVAVEYPPSGDILTASDLASAIAAGDRSLVEPFRSWAASQHGETRQAALQVIEGANSHLPGARRVLTGLTRPVLVDGSNVAWSGRTAASGPDMENIRQVRQKLFESGYFPVRILADAALPYQVKDADRLNRWLLRGEIHLVEGQTDADDILYQESRRLNCPIVTNDKMRHLDPERRALRITYTIGPGGVLLAEPEG